ncbi:MAG TPA: glucose 1-dehydrogenase [Terriglobales bacterium]|nr:glucose 1-dehydrogenase [Terriglobales bacterium]
MSGARVLVTGASSGIGRATAELFAGQGAQVAMVARRQSALADAARALPKDCAFTIAADVTREADAERCMREAVEKLGGLDVLVNAAGILKSGDITQTSLAMWDEMLNINLRAVFHLMQLAVPHLKASRGSVVNISSVTGLRSFPGVLAYCVSKAGVDQLTRCSALELAPFGIRVNAVNPGVVVTSLHSSGGMGAEQYEAFLERSKGTHPLGRVGQPQEVAELIAFLASERAAWITGETVSIDGGRALTCAR